MNSKRIEEIVYQNIQRDSECWIWLGRIRDQKVPTLWIPDEKVHLRVRNFLARSEGVKMTTSCGDYRCVNPDHAIRMRDYWLMNKPYVSDLRTVWATLQLAKRAVKVMCEKHGVSPQRLGRLFPDIAQVRLHRSK